MNLKKIKESTLGQNIIYFFTENFELIYLAVIILVFFIIPLINSFKTNTDKDYVTIKKLNNSDIVYDTETKLMYKIVKGKYMVQLWDYDEGGHPIAKYYEEDMSHDR
jgi:hypothetical protein